MPNDTLAIGALISHAYRQRNQTVGAMIAAAWARVIHRSGRPLPQRKQRARVELEPAQRIWW